MSNRADKCGLTRPGEPGISQQGNAGAGVTPSAEPWQQAAAAGPC